MTQSKYVTVDGLTLTGAKKDESDFKRPMLKFGFYENRPRFSVYKNVSKPITSEDFRANILNFPIDVNALGILAEKCEEMIASDKDDSFDVLSEETIFDQETRQPTKEKRQLGTLTIRKEKGVFSITVSYPAGGTVEFPLDMPFRNKFYAHGNAFNPSMVSRLYLKSWVKSLKGVCDQKQLQGAFRG